jgi:inner membrane protein
VLAHGAVAAVSVTVLFAALARDRLRVALLAFLAFHLHLLCDFFGSGIGWGITYFYPFSRDEFISPVQWDLNSWQNMTATVIALFASGWLAIRNGRTFAETVMPARWDALVVETLRKRFVTAG